MTKTINGFTYTHQTKHDPPQYARFLGNIDEEDGYIWVQRVEGGSSEYITYYECEFKYYKNDDSDFDLIPIPEVKIVPWTQEKWKSGPVYVRARNGAAIFPITVWDIEEVWLCYKCVAYEGLLANYEQVFPDGSVGPCGDEVVK